MTTILKHRELKTARRHLMPPQQHLYNGLARPADYLFAQEWTCPYDYRGWLTASVPMLSRDRHW